MESFANHPTTKDLKHAWCRPCLSAYQKARRAEQNQTKGPTRKGKRRYRTKKFANNMRLAAVHIHRAKRENPEGPIDEDITLRKLYYRDKRTCQICKKAGRPADVTWKQASIDHIIPYARGGTHTWDNIQLTHLECNKKKGAK